MLPSLLPIRLRYREHALRVLSMCGLAPMLSITTPLSIARPRASPIDGIGK